MTTCLGSGITSKRMRQSPTRRRNPDNPCNLRMSPRNGSCCISAIAARIRFLSPAGIRLRDFLAGPDKTTVHSIDILLERHRIAPFVRSHPTAISARFGGRREPPKKGTRRQVDAQRFPHQLRTGSVFSLPGSLDLLCHCRRKGDGKCCTFSHSCYFVTLSDNNQ